MTEPMEREPEYDPESVGLPGTVDPDSTAYDEFESGRESDGPETPVSPYDRPIAADAYGTTPEEAQLGTPLDWRLAAEVPDVTAEAPASTEDSVHDPEEANEPEGDRLDEFDAVAPTDLDAEDDPGAPVGRLAPSDDPDFAVRGEMTAAADVGFAGGGLTAEEAAMHLVDEPD
jgi:Family of unknown function (DUF5709)